MADFDVILPANTNLYKGETKITEDVEESWLTDDRHAWFAEESAIAKLYGPHVHTFKTTSSLKLINISSPLFHMDFIGKVNLLYKNNNGADFRKSLCLMPLGLPTTKEARFLASLGVDSSLSNFNDENESINNWSSYYYGAQRMSVVINQTNLDDYFVNALKSIYGSKYNGYIQPIHAPTAIFGGKLNNPEVCLFKSASSVRLVSSRDYKSGGGVEKVTYANIEGDVSWLETEDFNTINKRFGFNKITLKDIIIPIRN